MKTYYGFSEANREGQAAWFHTRSAAERFNAACSGVLGDVEECSNPAEGDIMDTENTPWTAEGGGE